MEGLEIAEVFVSEPLNTELFRLEAEFYTANTFDLEKYFRGADIIDFVQYGTSEELNENFEGFPVLRLNEFDSLFIAKPSKYCKVIDKSTYNSLKLEKDDVLICRTNGNPKLVGKSALVTQSHEYAYASYLFKIRPKRELINSATLVVFLNSKYGRLEIEKYSMASNQVNFSPAKFRELRIPDLGSNINQKIENIVYDAFGLLEKSKVFYQQAENILLETLGLKDIVLSSESVNIKSFSESFLTTGRLDAEYYQKKYEDVIERIKQYKFGYNRLESFIKDYSTGYPYKSDNYTSVGIPVIRINNITNGVLNLENAVKIDHSDINLSEKDIAVENDLLISMSGSIGNSCKIPIGIKAVVNQRIMRITPKNFNVDVLALIINSHIGKTQLDRIGTGGVQTNISATDIKQILIPNLPNEEQVHISNLVKKSFILKNESEQLLNTAKLAVELAIEEGEEKGLEIIRKLESI